VTWRGARWQGCGVGFGLDAIQAQGARPAGASRMRFKLVFSPKNIQKRPFYMKFVAEIDIMPHRELLDPQGKAVVNNVKHLDLAGIQDVRIGRHVSMTLEAASEAEARQKVEIACQKLLANVIMETFAYSLKPA
jgi:phosphoribosylformylglycinamidine synthase